MTSSDLANGAARDPAAQETDSAESTGPSGLTGRVLLVEDDRASRMVLARSLRENGHVVAEAGDTAQALDWTHNWAVDVILLDRFLPDGDGMALLAELKGDATTRDVPVVIVTNAPERAFVADALRAGAHDYLAGPFQPEEVLARTHAALRTKHQLDELRQLASHDALTGLRNRRGLAEQLTSWRAYCRRHGTPLTLAMLDINGFKAVNDLHSHSGGDRVLRAVAELLQACVRVEDVVGRWGGDEFLVLLPRADAATAQALLARVNQRLAAQQLLPEQTVSLRGGVSVVHAHDLVDDEVLLGRVAVALLHARQVL